MRTPESQSNISALYPELSVAEAWEAADNMRAYIAVIIRIYKRVSADPEAVATLREDLAALTDPTTSSTLQAERSNSNN